jgi:arabinan endo-1,5-alpha-L-arabinosidase
MNKLRKIVMLAMGLLAVLALQVLSPYFKIAVAGTDRTLAATADGEVVALPAFTGSPEQLWRIDQLTDGTYRIMPKPIPDSKEPMVLTAVGHSTPTLARFDPKSDKARWNFKRP